MTIVKEMKPLNYYNKNTKAVLAHYSKKEIRKYFKSLIQTIESTNKDAPILKLLETNKRTVIEIYPECVV